MADFHTPVVIVFLLLGIAEPCALPYWWIQEFSLPPSSLQSVQPKTTYRYRETLQVFDPNSFVHVKEYSEYSWWEHNLSNNLPENAAQPPSRKDVVSGTTAPPTTAKAAEASIMVDTAGVVTPKPNAERNENETDGPMLDELLISGVDTNEVEVRHEGSRDEKKSENFFDGWFNKKIPINETQPCTVSEADIHSLRSMIEKMFSSPRDHVMHPDSKEKAREDILKKFREFGLQVWTQNFTAPPTPGSVISEDAKEGVNLVGVIPGSQRGQLNDGIVLVGAHYDTVSDSNGV